MPVRPALFALLLAGTALAQPAPEAPKPPPDNTVRADPGAPAALLPSPTVPSPGANPGSAIPGGAIPGGAVPSPTIPAPAVPSPRVQAPFVPSPTVPSPAILTPTIPSPTVPSPTIPSPAREEVPATADELLDRVVEADIAGRCLANVELPRNPAMPGQAASDPAARGGRAPATRVVIAFDASGSMAARAGAGAETKMQAAQRAARAFLERLGPDVEVGLVAFGHRGSPRNEGRAASCAAADALVPLDAAGRTAAMGEVDRMRPVGWTPLAAAMEAASRQFRPSEREGEQLLLVISDGVETCGGDPVAVARRLNTGNLRVVVDIVGFDIAPNERAALQAVARAGGGDFVNVSGREAAADALRASRERTLNNLAASRAQTTANLQNARTSTTVNLAVSRASSCVNLAISRESSAFNLLSSRIRPPEPVQREAYARLDARHRDIRARFEAYAAALRERRDADVARVAAELTEALKPPSR